ncbi:Protein YNG1 [Merluccius polli]|uniref:Protein YNG1 n=1 Tax=Merluccius polli TaxID=89951 RepID=A0AA47M7A9_MERPO|nr:Protein YNG1 [Merluccius polli]
MQRAKENNKEPYRLKLNPAAKKRYKDKIKTIKGLDPYEHKVWSADINLLPNFQHPYIYNYMVLNVSAYTHEVYSNFKSVQQGQVFFTDGWVQDLEIVKVGQKTVISSKVNHSMRLSQKPLQPWVILSACGEVESAHCTCMAGVAEKCSHVAALLYKIDTAVRLRGHVTPTDVEAYWVMPSNITKVQGVPGHAIDFTTSSARKKALERSICGDTSTAPKIRTHLGGTCLPQKTLEDLKPLTDLMHAHRSGLCSVMEEFCHHYADPIQPSVTPKSLLRLRNPEMDGCDLMALLKYCEGLKHLVAVTGTEAAALEKNTKQQHKSDLWHSTRAGRITASIIHAVVSTSITTPAKSTVEKVCYPQKPSLRQTDSGPEAIQWGREKEDTARVSYITETELRHRDMKVEQCGFIVNPSFPEIGATPDALVYCACCGKGCLEIKCPFKHWDHNILQACTDKDFCVQFTEGRMLLKKTHKYYKQVQTQIFVTESQFCDFVVWTTKSLTTVRVMPDVGLWETLLPAAQDFFYKVVLPELVAHHYTNPPLPVSSADLPVPLVDSQARDKNKKRARKSTIKTPLATVQPGNTAHPKRRAPEKAVLWCFCRQPEELDDMVACDNQNCPIEWFHLGCVGLSSAPAREETWQCDACLSVTYQIQPTSYTSSDLLC